MKVRIIAEAGVNHNGDFALAKKLVDKASEAGADYVKFQLFKAKSLVTKTAKKADYQVTNTKNDSSQFEMLKKLELSYDQHLELIEYCKEKEIGFMSSAFDLEGLDELNRMDLDFFKVPSGEITNYPYIKKLAGYNREVILSTGMSNMDEIVDAVGLLVESGLSKDKITVLHCNTEYPTPMKDVNLRAMNTIGNKLGTKFGYSDHTLGIEVLTAAVAMGASVVEKHFTLDKEMEGPDHKASLNPLELTSLVKAIRNIEIALGSEVKAPSESEKKNIDIARKSIVALRDISEGDTFSEENLTTKRPGSGLSPMKWNEILGKKANRNYKEDELIVL